MADACQQAFCFVVDVAAAYAAMGRRSPRSAMHAVVCVNNNLMPVGWEKVALLILYAAWHAACQCQAGPAGLATDLQLQCCLYHCPSKTVQGCMCIGLCMLYMTWTAHFLQSDCPEQLFGSDSKAADQRLSQQATWMMGLAVCIRIAVLHQNDSGRE